MDYALLDELVTTQKKTDAPKSKKAQYNAEMVKLLTVEGFSERAEYYLKAGAGFSGALPFVEYIKPLSVEERSNRISALITGSMFRGDDKPNAFRYAISLLGYSITWFPDDHTLLIEMIKVIPSLAYNKEKHLLKDAPKVVEKTFLKHLKSDTILPPLYSLGLKDIFIKEFRNVMVNIVSLIPSQSDAKGLVLLWLKNPQQPDVISAEKEPKTESEEHNADSPAIIRDSAEDESKPASPVPADYKKYDVRELGQVASEAEAFAGRLRASIRYFAETQKESEHRREKIDALERELASVKRRAEESASVIERLEKENTEANGTISDLRIQLLDAKRKNDEQAHQLDAMRQDIEKLNSVISVFSADKQNSQSEQLNAIASKLKAEYVDFKEAEQDSMTLDLGENFRCQLQSVFRILAKAGIDVEKR